MRRFVRFAVAGIVGATLLGAGLHSASAAGTSSITGVAFQDADRDGVRDAGEPGWSNHQLYLYTAGGTYVAVAYTSDDGSYTFSNVSDGSYVVRYASPSWNAIRSTWAPTTTETLVPKASVMIAGAPARADFGWRQIVRSTSASAPISTFTGANGLSVRSYDDVVPASEVYDHLMAGGLVGQEASSVTIFFDLTSSNTTSSSTAKSDGRYSSFSAYSYISYAAWLEGNDKTLFHEYGHAWSQYYYYLVQQDPTMSGYLAARHITGDPRLGSSYAWDPNELIAEDYRQLFGSASAQVGGQANTDLPPASEVSGLKDYLAGAFRQAQTSASAPVVALSVTDLGMSPTPVTTSGTARLTTSKASNVTLRVLDGRGTVVKTLLSNQPVASGQVTAPWDRTNSSGRRVKAGKYRLVVVATDETTSATSEVTFDVA